MNEKIKQPHILVVDDEQLLRKLTLSILTSAGYQVTTCSSGTEAIALYREQPYDLVIMDMIMPGPNGIETFRALIDLDPQAKVVIISGFSEQKVTEDLYELGLAGFLEKPVPRAMLLSEVERILSS